MCEGPLGMAVCSLPRLFYVSVLVISAFVLFSGCAVPPSKLLNPLQSYERDFPAIFDDIWLLAIDAIRDDQIIKRTDFDEGLIVVEPKTSSNLMSGVADCGAQPMNTTLEKSYTGTISIQDIGEGLTRVQVKFEYRISTQSLIDQRIQSFFCRSTGLWEQSVMDQIEKRL